MHYLLHCCIKHCLWIHWKKGPRGTRTPDTRFKVWGANHYTIGPYTFITILFKYNPSHCICRCNLTFFLNNYINYVF